MAEYIRTLNDAQVGSLVVAEDLRSWTTRTEFRFVRVERVTAKQIVIEGDFRFWKENGRELGRGNMIYAPGEVYGNSTYADMANQCKAVGNVKSLINLLSNRLAALDSTRNLNAMKPAALQELHTKLGDFLATLDGLK